MRQKRAKAYRKLMAMYELSFGFRQPYQILVDSGMFIEAQDHKMELAKQLETVLQGKIKPMVTQCCIVELYKLGKDRQVAVDMAKEFERRKCNHREAIEGSTCLREVVGATNKHRYVIASQDHDLRVHLRTIQAVPLIHVKKSVMVLEPPSDETLRIKAAMVEDALNAPESEKETLPSSKPSEAPFLPKPHRKAKGPNPLSVKKKKPKTALVLPEKNPQQESSTHDMNAGQKRKRDDNDGAMGSDDITPKAKKRRRRKPAHEATLEALTESV
ncbi:hypothetical protein M408DRAFT_326574 [Serendipita vermifera MAFF 305830]|uniref:U three protein 23 n=1 Tax=Serendipita vermifera MAFF 305830 TaxID=933852 RepID=A0A0C3BLA6_SERVB|nr:hypothetical protein M408DRAFT_326574 [Serendipita vermifera MAFF 305830]